jgi:hypothetical protein
LPKTPGRKLSKDRLLLRKEFVERLAQGYGISEACRKLQVSRQTIHNWRKKDEAFDAEVERVLADPIHQTRILRGESKTIVSPEEKWQYQFIGVYRKTGDRNAAILACDKPALFIEQALDPMSDSYDAEFAAMYSEEQQRKLWTIEDNTMNKAEHDAPTARFVLSNLMKAKYGKLEGSSQINQFWFTAAGEADAAKELGGLNFGQEIEATSRPILPASEAEH